MSNIYERTDLLIGEEGRKKLQNAKVAVIGVGGVGSYAAEALARSGVGHIVLMDKDEVDETNLNRQLQTSFDNIGKSKVLEMKKRIESYARCEVTCVEDFFTTEHRWVLEGCDYVVDAIDTMSAKFDLIELCHEMGIPCISSLGMANRLDPSQVYVTTLDKTYNDRMAKACRQIARKRGIKYKVKVVASKETAVIQNQEIHEEGTRKQRIPPGSMVLVPAMAGLMCAYSVIKDLVYNEPCQIRME